MYDTISKRKFLLDPGATVSVFPASKGDTVSDTDTALQAANGSQIKTFGERLISLNIGLRRDFIWPFTVACVDYPIIGADFLANYRISMDLHRRTITDTVTGLSMKVDTTYADSVVVASTQEGRHLKILRKYPTLTKSVENIPK